MINKTSNTHSWRSWPLGLAARTSTLTGASICAILTLLLLGSGLFTQTASAAIKVAGTLLIDLSYQRGILTDPNISGRVTNWSNFGSLGGAFVQADLSPYSSYGIGAPGAYPGPDMASLGGYNVPNTPGARCLVSTVATPAALQGASTYTIETWLWKNNTATDQRGVFAWTENTPASGDAGKFCAGDPAALHNNGKDLTWNGNYPPSGAWHHTALTYDGTTESLYLDGSLVNSGTKTLNVSSDAYYPIIFSGIFSATPAQTSLSLNGALAAVRVHSGALSAGDVANNYALGISALVGNAYTISGTISCSDAQDPAGAVVQLKQNGNVVGSMTVPSGGAYSFTVQPGTYTIAASLNTYAPATSSPISVTSGNVTQNLTLTKLAMCSVSGTVHDGPTGISGVTVTATYSGGSYSTTSAGDGTYFLIVPATLLVTMSASTIPVTEVVVSVPAPFTAPDTTPITGKDVVLGPNPDYDPDLIFSLRSSDITSSGWPTRYPAGGATFTKSGTPSTMTFNGQQWEANKWTTSDRWLIPGTFIPNPTVINGGSIVVVARPVRSYRDNHTWDWDSIVDIQYSEMCIGIKNWSGEIVVRRKTSLDSTGVIIPDGRVVVLSLVVQPTGQYVVYTNGVQAYANTGTATMTVLSGGNSSSAIGGNAYDGWPEHNGNIGDVYVYQTSISDAKRTALEASLIAKFGTTTPVTITRSTTGTGTGKIAPNGPNGVFTSANVFEVPTYYDQTFNITPFFGCTISAVLSNGVSVGTPTSITFSNVTASQTLAVTFAGTPYQGLVWYYNCDGNLLDTAPLNSHNNGTAAGTVSYVPGAPNALVPGQAIQTAFSGNYVNLPNTKSIAGLDGSFSVAFWMQVNPGPGGIPVGGFYNLITIANGDWNTTGTGYFYSELKPDWLGGSLGIGVQNSEPLFPVDVTGNWQHLAYVYDGVAHTMTAYTNGVLQSSKACTIPDRDAPYTTTFGAKPSNSGGDWTGWTVVMDEVGWYDIKLTAGQVGALAHIAPPQPQITSFTYASGGLPTCTFLSAAPGYQYRLVYKTNLADTNPSHWLDVHGTETWTPSAAFGVPMTLTDPSPSGSQRFYEVQVK